MFRRRRKRYKTGESETKKMDKKIPEIIKGFALEKVSITEQELKWIDEQKYKCALDRELLYILLVLQKAYEGTFTISNKKNGLTCNKIDKWLGDGVCICKNGLSRLDEIGVISLTIVKKKITVKVNVPKFDNDTVAFECEVNRSPLIAFYKNNEERKVVKCAICDRDFIKIKNKTTCSPNCSSEQEKRRKRKEKSIA